MEITWGLGRKFSQRETPATPQLVKGALLSVADQTLGALSDTLLENAAADKGLCLHAALLTSINRLN